MTPLLLLLVQADVTIQRTPKFLVVKAEGNVYREPLQKPVAKELAQVIYRKDNSYAVWDSRGLSIRHGRTMKAWRLGDVALTPKLFSKEEIVETRSLIAKGTRKKNASALSGSKRIGNDAYFLVRWDEKSGKPWLEALIRVNLASKLPVPELVGRFEGLSLARKKSDDKLFVMFGLLAALVRHDDGKWSLATFDPESKEFKLTDGGEKLTGYTQLSQKLFIVQEKLVQGTTLLSRVDFSTGSRKELLEAHGTTEVMPGSPLLALEKKKSGGILRNLDSGARISIAADAEVRRTEAGMLIWSASDPGSAVLYNPERWERLASVGG